MLEINDISYIKSYIFLLKQLLKQSVETIIQEDWGYISM